MASDSASSSVESALAAMATLVQRGDFAEAEAIGNAAPVPLALSATALQLGPPLSTGAQAAVHAATLQNVGPVAVKRGIIRERADLVRLRREASLLAELAHPCIVELLGARFLPPHYQLVLSLAEGGNAGEALHERGWRPRWPGALALGAQLASALAHMHAAGVVHRDVKPANLLLTSDRRSGRLADLGLALRPGDAAEDGEAGKPSGGFHKRIMVGTMEYMAPELLLKAPASPGSDVFALATTMNELAATAVPYCDCTRDNPLAHTILEMGYGRQELAAAVAAEGLRPSVAPGAPPAVVRLLRACWDADPERRPSAEEVQRKLSALAAAHPWEASAAAAAAAEEEENGGSLKSKTVAPGLCEAWPSLAELKEAEPPGWAAPLLADAAAARLGPVVLGSFATAGARGEDRMEDRCLVIRSLFGLQHCSLAAVFDGHRGPAAADYLASSLERHLEARWSDSQSPTDLLTSALLDADTAFRTREDAAAAARGGTEPRTSFPGSTAVVALIIGSQLSVANLGDSRCVLARGQAAVALTQDQTAERQDERERIQKAGGEVSVRAGGWRVGAPGLAVTRSVGDADVKGDGVTAEAEVETVELGPEDSFFVLGSDGIWDLVSGEDAVGLVLDTVKAPAMCAQRVVTEALARGSRDNASVVVGFLPGGEGAAAGTAERVFVGGRHKYEGAAGTGAARVAARLVEDGSYGDDG